MDRAILDILLDSNIKYCGVIKETFTSKMIKVFDQFYAHGDAELTPYK